MLIFNQQLFQRQIDDSQTNAIYCFFYLKWHIEKVLFKLNMKLEQVRKYVKEFKKCLKQKSKANMKYLGTTCILNSVHEDFIREIIAHQTKQPETLQSIRIKLKQHFVIEQRLSESIISRFLHSQLRMSYKKQSKINPKVMTPSGVAKVTKWAAVIKALIDRGDEVLFIDEFSVNSRTRKQYGWFFVGSKLLFWEMLNQFSSRFMVGLSQREYYPVFRVNGSF